jgi:hypothetical protein
MVGGYSLSCLRIITESISNTVEQTATLVSRWGMARLAAISLNSIKAREMDDRDDFDSEIAELDILVKKNSSRYNYIK